MKKLALLLTGLFLITSSFSQSYVKKFFKLYNNYNIGGILDMSTQEVRDQMKYLVENLYDVYGKIKTYKQIKKTETSTDEYILKDLYFECEANKIDTPLFLRLNFVKFKDSKDYLLSAVQYSPNKDFIVNYDTYVQIASEKVDKFYQYTEAENYEELKKMLYDKSLENDFADVLQKRRNYYGSVDTYYNLFTSIEPSDEAPDTYKVTLYYKCKTEDGGEFYEKFVIFLDKDRVPYILSYYYGPDIESLSD